MGLILLRVDENAHSNFMRISALTRSQNGNKQHPVMGICGATGLARRKREGQTSIRSFFIFL
jgi:hypothetical protein